MNYEFQYCRHKIKENYFNYGRIVFVICCNITSIALKLDRDKDTKC